MVPVSSATGMNRSGGTRSPASLVHRARASIATTRPDARSTIGW